MTSCRLSCLLVLTTITYLQSTTTAHTNNGLPSKGSGRPPNIVIFLADDLGSGDIGAFGNTTLRTPHVDAICKNGVKLSHDLAGAVTCTPSRAAFLTGRLAIRSGMSRIVNTLMASHGLPDTEVTMAQMMKDAGYTTALIGKWHLGWHKNIGDKHYNPTRYGFDYFFGTPFTLLSNFAPNGKDFIKTVFPNYKSSFVICMACGLLGSAFIWKFVSRRTGLLLAILSVLVPGYFLVVFNTFGIWNAVLERNLETVEMPMNLENMTQRLVNEGIQFLEKRQRDQEPFFLMMSWLQVHTPLHASAPYKGRSAHGPYGDEVEEMDASVGQILDALRHFGFHDNTLVYFSSDHGGDTYTRDIQERPNGGSNGIFRGSKGLGGQEGGIRVPTCLKWPGQLPAGAIVTEPTSHMDIYVTLAGIVGSHVPTDRHVDGKDILPLLRGDESVTPQEFFFHYTAWTLHAIRYRPRTGNSVFKLHYFWPDWKPGTTECKVYNCIGPRGHIRLDTPKLFDVTKDPREEHELDITLPEYAHMLEVFEQARKDHMESLKDAVPLQGGRSLAPEIINPLRYPFCEFPWRLTCQDPQNALSYKPSYLS